MGLSWPKQDSGQSRILQQKSTIWEKPNSPTSLLVNHQSLLNLRLKKCQVFSVQMERRRKKSATKKEERAENEKELKKKGMGRPAMSMEEKQARKQQILQAKEEAKVDLKDQMEKK